MANAIIVELRKKSTNFTGDDKIHYVKSHVKAVDGLMIGEKISLSLLPPSILKAKKLVGVITSNKTTAELRAAALAFAGSLEALNGCYFFINTSSAVTITVSATHSIENGDNVGGTITSGQTVDLEDGDEIGVISLGGGWTAVQLFNGSGTTNPTLPNPSYKNGSYFFNTTSGKSYVNISGNWVSDDYTYSHGSSLPGTPSEGDLFFNTTENILYSYADTMKFSITDNNQPLATTLLNGLMSSSDKTKLDGLQTNATHTGDVTGSGALTIANGAVTLAKMANLAAESLIGNNTGSSAVPKALSKSEVRTFLNVADGADVTPSVTQSGTPGALKTITSFTLTNNKLTALTFADIQSGSTSAKGVVQLADNSSEGDWKTSQSTSEVTTPQVVKSMIDFFSTLKIYTDLAAANAVANLPDGTFALIQTGTVAI